MAFIVPDHILDKLICNSCHKYLSVKPVKVYPNRRIKCGRCSRSKKQGDGVVSLYGLVADRSLFKCINRFDGCRELLTYSQVRDHEKICSSRSTCCPLCLDSEEVTTYFLVKHFRDKHKTLVLKYPGFIVNCDSQSETSGLYMYVLEDNVSFVTFHYSRIEKVLSLNISHNGDIKAASNLRQKFSLFSDNEFKYCTKKKPCTPLQTDEFYSFFVNQSDLAGIGKTVFVQFELESTDPTLVKLPLRAYQSSSSDALDTVSLESLSLNENIVPTAPFLPSVDPSIVRRIHLSVTFLETFPNFSLTNCRTAIIYGGRLIFLHCFNCQEICWRSMSHDSIILQFNISITTRHSLCYYCFNFLKSKKKIQGDEYMLSPLSSEQLKAIEFLCQWQCGKTFVANDHIGHEESCDMQPFQTCPSCNFSGRLVDISSHMGRHGGNMCFYTSFYITHLFSRNIYVWVGNRLVSVRILTNSELNIVVRACGEQDASRPIMLLFDDRKRFLMSFENSISTSFDNHWVKVMLADR